MSLEDVMELLKHPAPAFWCSNNTDRTDERQYLVPVQHVCHEPLEPERQEELRRLVGTGPSARQIVAFYAKHDGAGLFVHPRTNQCSIMVLPFAEWADRQVEALRWIEHELECCDDEGCPPLPFTVEKLLAIAALNWSPDTWFLAADGAAAGKVVFWGHDGDPLTGETYAEDFVAFLIRLFKEAPECFGGIVRFGGNVVVGEHPPAGTELFPRRYVTDWHREVDADRIRQRPA